MSTHQGGEREYLYEEDKHRLRQAGRLITLTYGQLAIVLKQCKVDAVGNVTVKPPDPELAIHEALWRKGADDLEVSILAWARRNLSE